MRLCIKFYFASNVRESIFKGQISGLTGMSFPKIQTLWSSLHRGRILLQFIIISNSLMSEHICIEIRLTFICSFYIYCIYCLFSIIYKCKPLEGKKSLFLKLYLILKVSNFRSCLFQHNAQLRYLNEEINQGFLKNFDIKSPKTWLQPFERRIDENRSTRTLISKKKEFSDIVTQIFQNIQLIS